MLGECLHHLVRGHRESTLTLDVPRNARPGDQYVFDVEQRDAQGVRTGGVRLMINVVAEG